MYNFRKNIYIYRHNTIHLRLDTDHFERGILYVYKIKINYQLSKSYI